MGDKCENAMPMDKGSCDMESGAEELVKLMCTENGGSGPRKFCLVHAIEDDCDLAIMPAGHSTGVPIHAAVHVLRLEVAIIQCALA